jgi:hypothetical protein
MNREEAWRAGSKRYTAEKPCSNGHEPVRYTSTGACCQCIAKGKEKWSQSRAADAWRWPLLKLRSRPEDAAALGWFVEATTSNPPRPDIAAVLGAVKGLHAAAVPRTDIDLNSPQRQAEFERVRRRQLEAEAAARLEADLAAPDNVDPLTGEPRCKR